MTLAPGAIGLRRVGHGDEAVLQALFDGLSPASRRARFHGAVRELPSAWIERLAHPDPHAEVALLAQVRVGGKAIVVAEGRCVVDPDLPGAAEFALTVIDAWQGRGIGRQLLQALEEAARQLGAWSLFGDVLRTHRPMLALAQGLQFRTCRHPDDARLVRVWKRVAAPPLGRDVPGCLQ